MLLPRALMQSLARTIYNIRWKASVDRVTIAVEISEFFVSQELDLFHKSIDRATAVHSTEER